jgi:cytochrome c553
MNEALAGASDDSVRELARFVSKLPAPQPMPDVSDPARIERAEMLARKNHCIICHKPDFSGGNNVPRLAGSDSHCAISRAVMSVGPPSGEADNDAHRTHRVGLRLRASRDGSESDGTCCQLQNVTA